jgi:hypothetical protein
MKLKIYLFLVFSFNSKLRYFAQNTLSIQAVEVGTNMNFDLNVSLQNQDNIAFFVLTSIIATAFSLLNGHELTTSALIIPFR